MKLPTSWKPRRKTRDELIRQGEMNWKLPVPRLVRWHSRWKVRLTPMTDELRQLQKDERMSTQQKAQRAREIAKK